MKETEEAKLRNALGPIYALNCMVLELEHKFSPELLKIVIDNAKQVVQNTVKISDLLIEIENKPTIKSSLPSEQEIEVGYIDSAMDADHREGFEAGAKWVLTLLTKGKI